MVLKHRVSHNSSPQVWGFKCLSLIAVLLFSFAFSSTSFAKPENTYGPTKTGQSLWQIAKESQTNSSYSLEQLVIAFYKLNPNAFLSGNMNMLKKGVYLAIPSDEQIQNTSNSDAINNLRQHVHALDLLRVDANKLKTAKNTNKKHQRRTRKLQKELARYRHKSKRWNQTYTALVKSKRNVTKSKNRVKKLSRLLLEKATLKSTPMVVNTDSTKSDLNKVNDRLGLIQSSLEDLNQSNDELVEQVQQLATLDERVNILEDDLGENDELVIQLKQTLQSAQKAIEEQQNYTKKLDQRLQELKADSSTSNEIESTSEANTTADNTHEVTPELTPIISESTIETSDMPTISENIVDSSLEVTIQTDTTGITESNDEKLDSEETTTVIPKLAQNESAENNLNLVVLKSLLVPEKEETVSSYNLENTATTIKTNLLNFGKPQIANPVETTTNHQRKTNDNASPYTTRSYWINLIKNKAILIGGILNGLILIFVFFKFFSKRQEVEGDETNSQSAHKYVSWQDREKPKMTS